MKTILTAELKLDTTSESDRRLLDMAKAYQSALNYPSRVAFENGKMFKQVRLRGRV